MSESLKTLLQQALDMLEEQALHIEAPMLPAGEELLNRIRAALSQQAEPVANWSCNECGATSGEACNANGCFLNEAAPAEPATAQDEREAYSVWRDSNVQKGRTDTNGYHAFKAGAAWQRTRPAQTEQQPIRLPERKRTDHLPKEYKTMTVVRAGLEAYNRALDDVAALNATPISQTEQQLEQSGLAGRLNSVIAELKGGFVACQRCGEQEDTATLDCVPELEAIAAALSAGGRDE